jgi:tetraacyldisaccharide 4'-kinase
LEVAHTPQALLSSSGREQPVESLRGEPVAAFCGLGNPTGFRHTLEACGFKVAEFREFPDHHRFRRDDVESLCHWAGGLDVTAVVCTHKDLVKLAVEELATRPLWALSVELEIVAGRDDFEARLRELLPQG